MVVTGLVEALIEGIRERRRRIVIIGDAITDVWVRGVREASQDGCEKFVQVGEAVSVPGGAANAHQCLAHWEANVDLVARIGCNRPVKTRFVGTDGRIVFRWDHEFPSVPLELWKYRYALELVGCAGGVLLSDYDKGALPQEFIRMVAELCVKRGIPCVADCKRAPSVYPWCILKGNRDYCRKYGELTVCTYGEGVPEVRDEFLAVNLPPVTCVNHVGAGDCFAAHFTLALTYGFSFREAAALAHSAGRVYVQHPHNRAPLPAEVMADLSATSM